MTSLVDLKQSQHNRPHQFVKYLSKNHDITLITINDLWKKDQKDLDNYSDDFDDIINGVQYEHITEHKLSPFLQEFFFRKKIKNLSKHDFDVHLNYNSMIMGYEASKKFKTVFDIADDIPRMIKHSSQIPAFLQNIGYLFGKHYMKKNIINSDCITLTNKLLANIYSIPQNKYRILSNGVDLSLFKYNKNAKEVLNLGDEFIIGYVGVLREWVNLEPLFKSLKNLNFDVKVLIVGKEGNFEHNIKLAKKYRVSDIVKFTGTVPYSKVPLFISAMDVCLIPFHLNHISNSAVPLKLFEYMACEKPIISSKIEAIDKKYGDQIISVSTSEEYVEILTKLYENPRLTKSMIKKGKKMVKNYDWKNICKDLEKILTKVVEN